MKCPKREQACTPGCPCARDVKKCAVKRKEAPTKETTKDALGQELSERLFKGLVAAHEAHHKRSKRSDKSANTASKATATIEEVESESDEDSDEQYEVFTSCLIGILEDTEEVFLGEGADDELEVQYDNGANLHILASAELAAKHGTMLAGCPAFTIGGIDSSSKLPAHGYAALSLLPPGPRAQPFEAAFAVCPRAKRHILGGIPLENMYGIIQLPEPADCLLDTRTGARYPLRRRNDQFFVKWRLLSAPVTPLPLTIASSKKAFVKMVKIKFIQGASLSGTLIRAPTAEESVYPDAACAAAKQSAAQALTALADARQSMAPAARLAAVQADITNTATATPHTVLSDAIPADPEAARAALPHARNTAVLWSGRLGLSSDGFEHFRGIEGTNSGLELNKLTKAERDALDQCLFRIAARAKRKPARRREPRKLEKGELWEIDHQPADIACPTDGSRGEFVAVDERTDYIYGKNVKTHTTADVVTFALELKAHAAKFGHTLKVLRFDRGPELATPKLKAALAPHGIAVEIAPRGRHQGVRRVEGKQDPIDRLADAQLKRARLSPAWRLESRMDAIDRLNLRAVNNKHGGRAVSRLQDFTGNNLSHLKEYHPYVFGCAVNMLEDEPARGPSRGKGRQGRSSQGVLLRTHTGSGYRVLKPNGEIVYPPHVTPLNEEEMIMRGWPAGAGGVDAAVSTPTEGLPKLTPLPASRAPRAPPAITAPVVVDGLDVADRVRVWWKPSQAELRAGVADNEKPYDGVVTKVVDLPDGTRLHTILYDDCATEKEGVYVHNLANGRRFQRVVPPSAGDVDGGVHAHKPAAPPTAKAARPANGTAALQKLPPVTRARARAALMTQALDEALDASTEPLSVFHAVAYQLVGDLADSIECHTVADLDAARREFYRRELSMLHQGRFASHQVACGMVVERLEALKAEKPEVHVNTPMGPRLIVVPRSARGIDKSLERDEWLIGLQKAVDAILAQRGNGLVRISIARESGRPVAECVVAFKVKTEKDTGALDRTSPFKVRLCYDEKRAMYKAILHEKAEARAGRREPYASAVADDTLIKCLLAVAATGRDLTKADVSDAYGKADRRGPISYMRMPVQVREYADDGEELVFELASPLWGETGAGRDWQDTLHADLLRIGWKAAENVPCLYTFTSPTGDCHLATIVDDLLFSESAKTRRVITASTLKLLRAKYGDVRSEEDPTSFAGFKLDIDKKRKAITISMPTTVEAMVDEHFPYFKQGKPQGILSGKALRDAADSLALPPASERAPRLSSDQKRTRSVTGSLKWIEKVKPRLSVGVHRLSCVMAYPPEHALRVAEGIAWWAWQTRNEGITYGGHAHGGALGGVRGALSAGLSLPEGAPANLLVAADATWGMPIDVIGIIITLNHAAVYHGTRKLGLTSLDSSHENECIATGKGAEANGYVREIARALGVVLDGPTPIYTDNLANLMVAMNTGNARGSKHFLRRYRNVQRRIEEGEAAILKIDDPNQPADFLTKWVGKAKLDASAEFAENSRARDACIASEDMYDSDASTCLGADDEWTVVSKHRRAKGLRVVRFART